MSAETPQPQRNQPVVLVYGRQSAVRHWCSIKGLNPSWFRSVHTADDLYAYARGTMLVFMPGPMPEAWSGYFRFVDTAKARGLDMRDAHY